MKDMDIFCRVRRILISVLFFSHSLFLFLTPAAIAESDKIVIYFYSSESSISNFNSLKTEFDTYFSAFGPYEFQPVRKRQHFENSAKERKRCLLLLSSWHYSKIYEAYLLRPALVGMRNGKTYQKRILVGKGASAGMEDAKTGTIASAGSIRHSRVALTGIFGKKDIADKAEILTVPKDIDALMSVGLGMAHYALTAENSVGQLKRLNPTLYKDMKIIAEGKDSMLLILAFPESMKGDKSMTELIRIIHDMPLTTDGRKKIKRFGLDGWERIDSPKKLKLEG